MLIRCEFYANIRIKFVYNLHLNSRVYFTIDLLRLNNPIKIIGTTNHKVRANELSKIFLTIWLNCIFKS